MKFNTATACMTHHENFTVRISAWMDCRPKILHSEILCRPTMPSLSSKPNYIASFRRHYQYHYYIIYRT